MFESRVLFSFELAIYWGHAPAAPTDSTNSSQSVNSYTLIRKLQHKAHDF